METTVVLLRLGQYIGAVLLFGVPLFFAFRMPMSDAAAERWPRTTLLVAAVATVLAALANLVVQTAVMAGSLTEALKPESLSYVAFGTGLGVGFLVRAAMALLAAVLLISLKPGRGGWIVLTVVGAVVSASLAWTGHGAATEGAGRWPHLIADVVHALAAGLWLGSLVALFLMLRTRHGHAAGAPVTHAALEGFAGLGTLAVVLLTITGLVNSAYLIGFSRLGSLLTTPYGVLLILKLVLFAGMLALAASNRFVLTPHLGSALEDDHARPLRKKGRTVQRRGIEPRRHRPIIPVAVTEIVGPFAVTHQVGARHLDLDDHQLSARVDRHQVGTAAALQRNFGDGDEVVAQQHPRDAARDVGGADRGIAALNARNRSHVEHDPGLEHSANEASAPLRISDRRRGCRSLRSW